MTGSGDQIPGPAHAPTRAAFVGRSEELAELRRALDALPAGRGSLFLLTGEPGIGKTRLAEELAAAAVQSGVGVHWGRCLDDDGRPAYWPWAQVVKSCVRAGEAAEIAASLAPDALPLAELVPDLRPHLRDVAASTGASDPETARFRLFQALTAAMRRVAAGRPMLVILDDLHWADLPSLRMLEFLVYELPDVPILIVGTLREIEVRRAPDVALVVDRLERHGRRLALAGLATEEVLRFVEAAAAQSVPEALAQRLRRETEGNPFFLDEIVREFRRAGTWSASSPLPMSQGVRSAIRRRLAPLPAATRGVLAAAAVAGREFDLPLVEAATRTPRTVLLEQLTPAVDAEIVSPIADQPGRYRFAHALVRETIYEEVRPSDAVSLHASFGRILEQRHRASLDAHLPELAHHFFAAAAGGGEAKALDYVERAGRRALQILAYEEAASHFQRALHLNEISRPDEPEREGELLLALAEAKHRAGQIDESSRACFRAAALARRIGSSALLARAAIGLCDIGVAWAEFGRCDQALLAILDEALQQLDPDDAALRAHVMGRIATEQFWTRPLDELDALSGEAVALARRAGDRRGLAYALMARIHCVSAPDAYDERRALIDEVLALSGGQGKLAVNAYLWRFGDELQFGDRRSAEATGETLIRAVQELRQPRDLWLVPAVRSRKALQLGRFDEAEQLAEQLAVHAPGVWNAEQAYLALLFMIRREQGRHGEMLDGLAAIASQSVVAVWRATLALLLAETGDADHAIVEIDALVRNGLQAIRRDLSWLFAVASLAAACSASGSRAHAAPLYDALLPYDGCTVAEGVFCYFGPVSYYLGLLATTRGDDAAAARHLDAALGAAKGVGARPFVARILLAQAHALEASDPTRSNTLRQQAAELAASMGMHGVTEAARRGTVAAPESDHQRAGLRDEGDFWVVSYKGRTTRIKRIKGFLYLARLLESPGEEFHVLEMTRRTAPSETDAPAAADGLGPVLDARAKEEIRRRLADLRDELAEAEANNDGYRASKLHAEIESIGEMVSGAVGLGGRDRTQGSHAERARVAVTKALRAAIERIEQFDPQLADVLARTIRTGVFCSYVPLAQVPIAWEIATGE